MFRKYKNDLIYENFMVAKELNIISLVISIISFLAEIIDVWITGNLFSTLGIWNSINYLFFLLIIPIGGIIFCKKTKIIDIESGHIKENKNNNDFLNVLIAAIVPFTPYCISVVKIVCCFFSVLFGEPRFGEMAIWANICGRLLIPHAFCYISSIQLFANCYYIKKEWKEDPPEFYMRDKEEKLKQQLIQKKLAAMKELSNLIQKCGLKFLIKHYLEVKNLFYKDIIIPEIYDEKEKESRIKAVKKIIEMKPPKELFEKILERYKPYLTKEELNEAKKIMEDLCC